MVKLMNYLSKRGAIDRLDRFIALNDAERGYFSFASSALRVFPLLLVFSSIGAIKKRISWGLGAEVEPKSRARFF